jgi:hypothetical protein
VNTECVAVVAKPPGTLTPVAAIDHFPKRSVLAADRIDIGHAQGFEGDDEAPFEMVHVEKVLA